MAEALKPCPFCGGQNIIVEPAMYGHGHTVSCSDCTAMVISTVEPPLVSRRDVITMWNRRCRWLRGSRRPSPEGEANG